MTFAVACLLHSSLHKTLLPGGFAFCMFSLQLGYGTKLFDINYLYKYLRIISVVSIVVLVLQDLSYYAIGYRFSGLLPFGKLTDGLPISVLIHIQNHMDRSCSIFREPAHVATFLLVVLAIELFWKGQGRLYTRFSIFLGVGLLVLRSGNGLLGLSLLAIVKFYYYIKKNKSKYGFISLIFGVICSVVVVHYYGTTETGAETMERVSEFENNERSKSYIRIYRGFVLLSDSPGYVKIFGTNNEGILKITRTSKAAYLFDGHNEQADLYFNGIQSIILHDGFVGLSLFLIYIFSCLKKAGELSTALGLTLAVISFVGGTYLSSLMLTVCIIINSEYFRRKKVYIKTSISRNSKHINHENCLLHKTRI